jgi:hypothetical protein
VDGIHHRDGNFPELSWTAATAILPEILGQF